MPLSKREKLITLAKSKPGGRALKEKILDTTRDCVDKHQYLYVVSLHNERNAILKELRNEWKGNGVFLFAKNRVIGKALDGYRPDLEKVKDLLKSEPGSRRGIFFANADLTSVQKFFDDFQVQEYARAGCVAEKTITIPEGPLEFPFSLEATLRALGLKTSLKKGVVQLLEETTLCRAGETMTPEQCRLLKLFGIQTANFHVQVHAVWTDNKLQEV